MGVLLWLFVVDVTVRRSLKNKYVHITGYESVNGLFCCVLFFNLNQELVCR